MFLNNHDKEREELVDVMEEYDLDIEEAEEVLELAEELGVDNDDAAEIHEAM